MTGPTLTFTIPLNDLRRGLTAVLPHVSPDKDDVLLHQVRIDARQPEVLLMATDRFTAAIYATDAGAVDRDGIDVIDLTPADIRKILAVFKPADDAGEDVLTITADEKQVRLRDVSGLFPGAELELPTNPPGEYVNLPAIFAKRLDPSERGLTDRLVSIDPRYLARFAASGKVMGGDPLLIDTQRSPFLVHAGDSFLGGIMPVKVDAERLTDSVMWQSSWMASMNALNALPSADAPEPEAPPVGAPFSDKPPVDTPKRGRKAKLDTPSDQ